MQSVITPYLCGRTDHTRLAVLQFVRERNIRSLCCVTGTNGVSGQGHSKLTHRERFNLWSPGKEGRNWMKVVHRYKPLYEQVPGAQRTAPGTSTPLSVRCER